MEKSIVMVRQNCIQFIVFLYFFCFSVQFFRSVITTSDSTTIVDNSNDQITKEKKKTK